MKKIKSRLFYLLIIVLVISLGLLSRKMAHSFPKIINMFLGDGLWALMVFFIIRMIFIKWTTKKVALSGLLFCYFIEISQLYHTPWIDSIRATTLGGLVLGYGFLWSDLMAYLIGIGVGIAFEVIFKNKLIKNFHPF